MKLSKRQLKRIIREEYTRLKRRGLIKEMITRGDHAYEVAVQMIGDFESPETISFIRNCDKGIELMDKWQSGMAPEGVGYDLDEALEYMEMDEGLDLRTACQALINAVYDM